MSIWHYTVSVKSMVKISSILVAFLENANFKKVFTYTKDYHSMNVYTPQV